VVGTTGAGDATIAGFIAALLKGLPIEQTLTMAVAVGAFNVERADATSGIPDWATVEARVQAGWARRPVDIVLPGWPSQRACGSGQTIGLERLKRRIGRAEMSSGFLD